MAGLKISQLPGIVTPAVSDIFPVVQAGVTYQETITQLGTLLLLLSGGTMSGNLILNADPTLALQASTKQYVDNRIDSLSTQPPCLVATTANRTATYSNGVSGVGATLTNAGAMAALVIDGVSLSIGDRVVVKNQASTFQNGIYTVTVVGSGAVNWIMTRATDFNTIAQIQPGDNVLVTSGTVNTRNTYVQTATVATIGTDAITWNRYIFDMDTLITNVQNQSYVYSADTGAADAYVMTPSPAITSYTTGLLVVSKIANANTGACTANVSGVGAKNIKLSSGADPAANDLLANMIAMFMYDGTNLQLINPA